MRGRALLALASFWLLFIALCVAIAAVAGARLGLWTYDFGQWTLLPIGVGIGVVALVLGIAWAIAAFSANDGSGLRFGVIGLVGAGLLISLPIHDFVMARTAPPITDITTDTEHPPAFKALLALRANADTDAAYHGDTMVKYDGKTRRADETQRLYYGDLHTIAILTPPQKLFDRARRAAEAMGWHLVAVVPGEGRIEATDTTTFFGFTDDIVIRVKPAGLGARLDIRSKARANGTDCGRNAIRLRAFIEKLKKM